MKTKLWIMLALVSLLFASCECFTNSANAERIGSGYMQREKGLLFVEIDSTRYVADYVYTGSSSRDGRTTMDAVDGMQVTVFRWDGSKEVDFVAGDYTTEELESYFSANYLLGALLITAIVLAVISTAIYEERQRKKEGNA